MVMTHSILQGSHGSKQLKDFRKSLKLSSFTRFLLSWAYINSKDCWGYTLGQAELPERGSDLGRIL